VRTSRQRGQCAAGALVTSLAALAITTPAWGEGTLTLASAPALPTLTAVVLNGQTQTVFSTMTKLAIADTRTTKLGWNLTVQGQSGTGKSAVFAQYCPKAKCGTDSEGYVASGKTIAAKSLKLSSTGASLTGGTGAAPTFQCATACNLDSSTAVKIVSAASGGAGEGTWTSTGLSVKSLQLAVATSLRALPAEEVYRVNLLWTLASGP
jgi:putative surface cell wall-binding protein